MEVDNDHEEGNSKKCTSIEHVEGTERMEVDNDHEEGKSKKCTSIEDVEGKLNLDSGEIKRTNGVEKKDGHDQDSENEDNEAKEDENLEEAQKDYDQRADITIGSTSTCVQFINPDEVAFSIAPGQDAILKFILMDNDFEVLSFPH